ncbi:unnamed protein product [Calypogeia fissa]
MKRSSIIGSSNQVNKKSIFMDSQASVSATAQGRRSAPAHARTTVPPVRSSESTPGKGDAHARMTIPPVHSLESLVPDEAADATPRQPPTDGAQKSQSDFPGGRHNPLNAGERLQLQSLRQEMKRAQSTVDYLVKVNQTAMKKHEEPLPHCNPRIVTRVANSVISVLLLEKEILFPTEDELKCALLKELGITQEKDEIAVEQFMKHWSERAVVPNFYSILRDALRRRKGTFTKAFVVAPAIPALVNVPAIQAFKIKDSPTDQI